MNNAILFKFCLAFLFLFIGENQGMGYVDKYADSLFIETKYAKGPKKLQLTKTFSRSFYETKPKQTLTLIDQSFQQLDLSTLDNIEMHFLKGRASYYLSDFRGYFSNLQTAFDLIDAYSGPKTSYYYYLKYYQNYLVAIQKEHDGSPKEAMRHYIQALGNAEQSGDAKILVASYKSLGSFFIKQKDYELALTYLNKSLQLGLNRTKGSKEDEEFFLKLYGKLADAYIHNDQLDSARYYLTLIPEEKKSIAIYITCATYYHKKKAPLEAISILDSLISKVSHEGPKHWLPYLQMHKADNLILLKQFQKVQDLLLTTRLKFIELKDQPNILKVNDRLYRYFKQRGQFEQALIYHEEFKRINDSMLYTNYHAVLDGMEDSYALNIKEKENVQLKSKESSNQLTIQRQQLLGILGIFFLLALCGVACNYYKSASRKKKINVALKEENVYLTTTNKTIKNKVDELGAIVAHFPIAFAKLDRDLSVGFFNELLITNLGLAHNPTSHNIFEVLGVTEENRGYFKKTLQEGKSIAFLWTSLSTNKEYQVRIANTNDLGETGEYMMVMEDITELKNKEQLRALEIENSLKELEVDYQRSNQEKEILSLSLDAKNRELASKVMQISKRSADLEPVLSRLKELQSQVNKKVKLELYKIIQQIHSTLDIEENWKFFTVYFIKLGLSNKEVADLLNVSPKTVEVARYRIKKKFKLSREEKLNNFITQIA